jgi:hypothetical protein
VTSTQSIAIEEGIMVSKGFQEYVLVPNRCRVDTRSLSGETKIVVDKTKQLQTKTQQSSDQEIDGAD